MSGIKLKSFIFFADSSSKETSESTISLIILGAICLAFLVVLVLVVMNCGGCDDMSGDVSSENHPACGKQTNNFSPVVGDANTGVLMSSTTMGESASRIPPQNLPFSVQPATAQGLAGYYSAPQASAPVLEPPPPSYQQVHSLAGYRYQ
jgi:hypothetical protein